MKEYLRMILTLAVFCAVSGALLAWANTVTKGPIEQARRAELLDALKRVLPEHDNDVVADARTIGADGKNWTFYVARKGGVYAGTAFRSTADGYGGTIEILVGILADDTIKSMEILVADKETPGLGSKIRDAAFRNQFGGKRAMDSSWAVVKKDGGAVDAVTGATISSRAASKAVKVGLDVYAAHANEIKVESAASTD